MYGFLIAVVKTGMDAVTSPSALSWLHCIGLLLSFVLLDMSMPGSEGTPAVIVASKMNEFPVVVPAAVEAVRSVPDPVSLGFLQT